MVTASTEANSLIDGWPRASRRIAASIQESREIAILLVHVHGIERLCATLGHQGSDAVLNEVYADIILMAQGKGSVVRLTDRKFAVLLIGLRNHGHARLAAQKLGRILDQITTSDLRASIGIVLCPEHGDDPHELLRRAEIAVLDGQRRKEPVCFYETQSAEKICLDWDMEGRLADAIKGGDLQLHYQPKQCLRTNRIIGAEALMRWHDAELGVVSPELFIDLAESTGQIVDLTHFAIQRACRQLSEWRSGRSRLNVAVNVTPTIIQNDEIVESIVNACGIWSVDPRAITIEVTENSLMANHIASHRVLTKIRELGSRVSIDDFGTGYSSLSYLKEIPADELKIDRSFVMNMLKDPGDYKIVEHTIRLAASFGLKIVAEGIETAATLEELRRLDCDIAQGYFICKPLLPAEFCPFVATTEGPI